MSTWRRDAPPHRGHIVGVFNGDFRVAFFDAAAWAWNMPVRNGPAQFISDADPELWVPWNHPDEKELEFAVNNENVVVVWQGKALKEHSKEDLIKLLDLIIQEIKEKT